MLPTLVTHPDVTLASLQEALMSSPPSLHKKLLAIQLIVTGKSHKETCRTLQIGRNTLTRWIKVVNNEGLDGLAPRKKIGRPSILTPHEQETFLDALRKKPSEYGYLGDRWDGKTFHRFLEEQKQRSISVSAAYKILSSLRALLSSVQGEGMDDIGHALLIYIKNYRSKIIGSLR